ncbi:dynamin family protein [Microbispora sp. NPDC088329]|uniref:dynamin family protein n=1 Tax=Microbispora sp. NPDC088329 TaxID=3154869 RepID=UPI0034421B1B
MGAITSSRDGDPAAARLRTRLVACLNGLAALFRDAAANGRGEVPGRDEFADRIAGEVRSALGGGAPVGAVSTLRAVRDLTVLLQSAVDSGVGATDTRLATRAEAYRQSLDRLLAGERRLMEARTTLPPATRIQDQITTAAHDAVAAAVDSSAEALRSLRHAPLPGADTRWGREHARIFASRDHAQEYLERHCRPALRSIGSAVQTCLLEIDTVVGRCHAEAAAADQALRALAAEGAVDIGGSTAGGIARLVGAEPPRTPARPAGPRAELVAEALRVVARDAVHPTPPETSLVRRVVLAASYPRDLRFFGHRGHMATRDAVNASLAAACHRVTEALRAEVDTHLKNLWRGAFGAYLTARDTYVSRCADVLVATRRSIGHELAAVLTQQRALHDLASEFAGLRRTAEEIITGVDGEVPQILRWPLTAAAGHPGIPADTATELRRLANGSADVRVVVVAPMSAGKSTLINALLGAEVLPTRHAAMTCFPTYLSLRSPGECPVPTLRLDTRFRHGLQVLAHRIRSVVDPPESARLRVDRHLHLALMLQRLHENAFQMGAEHVGADRVREALTEINDLVRLCLLLTPGQSLPPHLREPVDVLVPYGDGAPGGCRIQLVDTPGLDEGGLSGDLRPLIRAELDKAHAVILVLDFTRLSSEADHATRELLRAFIEVVGDQGVWAVVNRVDQRRPGDRDEAGVRRLVRAEIGVMEEHIVEMSAHRAEVALAYLAGPGAAGRPEEECARRDDRTRALLSVCYPGDWEERLTEFDADRGREIASRLLARSGIRRARQAILTTLHRDGGRLMGRATARRLLAALTPVSVADPQLARLTSELALSLTITERQPT